MRIVFETPIFYPKKDLYIICNYQNDVNALDSENMNHWM